MMLRLSRPAQAPSEVLLFLLPALLFPVCLVVACVAFASQPVTSEGLSAHFQQCHSVTSALWGIKFASVQNLPRVSIWPTPSSKNERSNPLHERGHHLHEFVSLGSQEFGGGGVGGPGLSEGLGLGSFQDARP